MADYSIALQAGGIKPPSLAEALLPALEIKKTQALMAEAEMKRRMEAQKLQREQMAGTLLGSLMGGGDQSAAMKAYLAQGGDPDTLSKALGLQDTLATRQAVQGFTPDKSLGLTPERMAAIKLLPPAERAKALAEMATPAKPGFGQAYGADGQPTISPSFMSAEAKAAAMKDAATLPYSIARAAAGRSVTNVNMTQETEEAKTIGKSLGEQYADIQKEGLNAQGKISNLTRVGDLLNQIQAAGGTTGLGQQTFMDLKKAAGALGFSIPADVPPQEALVGLSNQLALEARSADTMPGALSNSDRDFLVKMTPSIATTPEGNRRLIDILTRVNQAKIEKAKAAREYRKANGSFEGFNAGPSAPAATPATPAGPSEPTATNPQTGERMVYRNGQWVKP